MINPTLNLIPFRRWCADNGLSPQTGYREAREGRLKLTKLGRRTYVRPDDAATWAAALPPFKPEIEAA